VRRLASLATALIVAGVAAALLASASAQGSNAARFDVIFDDARGLVGGQLVKIAGAKAGTIQNVVLTPDFKARVEALIDSRFMPFHQDATCAIRPEGLIAENYVDCDPGSLGSPALAPSGGHPPTVPVNHTTEPVSLLDLFNVFNLPTRQRFMVLTDELGIGTSGRGGDIYDILLRANPTLAAVRNAIGILARQRADLKTIIAATDAISAQGASHSASVRGFLQQAAALSTLTANHRDAISNAVARLPGMLAVAQPALQRLDSFALDSTPLLQQLHAAVPSLERLSNNLGPFEAAAAPGLAKLSSALTRTIPSIRRSTPLLRTLTAYSSRSLPSSTLFARLSKNLQRHGFAENFVSIAYYVGAALARFDATSHLLPLELIAPNHGACGNYSTTPVQGCSAHYGSQPPYKPQRGQAFEGLADFLLK
jgi:ABC-type transporter Mla subunit MlaD